MWFSFLNPIKTYLVHGLEFLRNCIDFCLIGPSTGEFTDYRTYPLLPITPRTKISNLLEDPIDIPPMGKSGPPSLLANPEVRSLLLSVGFSSIASSFDS